MSELLQAPIDLIRPNPAKLREVKTDSVKFQEFVESIRDRGVLNAVNGRRIVDPETKEEVIELVDGLHRFTACKLLGMSTIPMQILDIDAEGDDAEVEVYLSQIAANSHKTETKPHEYAGSLVRVLTRKPTLTRKQLAGMCNRSEDWLDKTLKLLRIENPELAELVNEGKIKISNAYALSSLPPEEQIKLKDEAVQEDPQAFMSLVKNRRKELKEAAQEGRVANKAEFAPRPRLRNLGAVEAASSNDALISSIIEAGNVSDPVGAFKLALDFVRHLDPATIAKEKAEWDEKQLLKEERKKQRSIEKAAKAAEKAKAKAAAAEAEAAALAGNAE